MTPIVVITGVDPEVIESVTVATQFDLPDPVVAAYRIDDATNQLVRTVSDIRGRLETERVELDHACTSCAIREDVIPALRRLQELERWGAIVAQLPAGASALQVCRVCALQTELDGLPLHIHGVVAAVRGDTVVPDLTSDLTLGEHGVPTFAGDDRGLAETLAGIVEYADAVQLLGPADAAGTDLLNALRRPSSLLATDWADLPGGQLVTGIHAHRQAEKWVAEVRRHDLPALDSDHVWSLDLCADRPLHPDRFASALETMCVGSHRIRGCVWLPTRATVCVLDGAAGQVRLGAHGPWNGAPTSRLTVVGLRDHAEPTDICRAFADCALTDDELLARGTRWNVRRDGLEPWLGGVHDLI